MKNIPIHFLDEIIALRRSLHMEPELSGEEQVTAKILENFFMVYQPERLITHLGGHGLAAIFESGHEGPTILIRADMDALPIQEVNQVVYRSTREGISHKCGHDGHMAIVAGLAPLFCEQKPICGRVVLLFQPAEETGVGALEILKDSRFNDIHPEYCFALHNLPGFPLGEVVLREDVFAAASVGMIVELTGKMSHAAYPEDGSSPAQAMAEIIIALESLNQSFDHKGHFCLMTLVSANLGEQSFGICPGNATIMATLRSFDDETLDELKKQASERASEIAEKFELQSHIIWNDYFPVTRNDSLAVKLIEESAQLLDSVIYWKPKPFRWSEDFGWFTREAPGALFGIGAGEDLILHSENYDFPEAIIEQGIQLFYTMILKIMLSSQEPSIPS